MISDSKTVSLFCLDFLISGLFCLFVCCFLLFFFVVFFWGGFLHISTRIPLKFFS